MNRKHNPMLSLVALILLALLLVTVAGCSAPAAAAEDTGPSNWGRFTVEYCGKGCEIITDTVTGVQYLAYGTTAGAAGLTVLQDGEG